MITRNSGDNVEQLKTVLYAIPHGIDIVDQDGRIRFMNRSMLDLFGRSIGKKCYEVYKDDGKQCVDCPLLKPLKTGESKTIEVAGIGGGRTYSVTHTAVRLPGRGGAGIVEVFMDITDQKKAALKDRELNECRSMFIQIVSHQLRTPLSAVRWNLELLLDRNDLKDEQRDMLQISHDAEVEVLRRLNDLILVMDIEKGGVEFHIGTTSMEEPLAAAVHDLSKTVKHKKLTVNFLPGEEASLPMKADPVKVRDIIYQLLKNACDYTAPGGRIEMRLKRSGRSLRFEIDDTGIGIPAAVQSRVFTKFFRAENALKMVTDAPGIGLYLAADFVRHQGGKIGFQSKENEGSNFWFTLPLMKNGPAR